VEGNGLDDGDDPTAQCLASETKPSAPSMSSRRGKGLTEWRDYGTGGPLGFTIISKTRLEWTGWSVP
jgi:hypothetical protein